MWGETKKMTIFLQVLGDSLTKESWDPVDGHNVSRQDHGQPLYPRLVIGTAERFQIFVETLAASVLFLFCSGSFDFTL